MVKNPTVMQETWAGSLDWEKCIYICVCVCVCVYKMYAECKGVTLNKEQRIPILVC